MSDPQQIEKDIREYLEKEPNLRREDRLQYLRVLFDKHFSLNKLDHVVNYSDFQSIISGAKSAINNLNVPLTVTRKRIESYELANVAMIEAVVSYLNKNQLLKKQVKFDFT